MLGDLLHLLSMDSATRIPAAAQVQRRERVTNMIRRSGDVSPIDEVPDMSAPGSRPRQASAPLPKSNIPMMRRQRRHEQDAANTMLRETKSRERARSFSQQHQPGAGGEEGGEPATGRQVFRMAQGRDMRWDRMTGEPTLGSTGLSGQVKPAEYVQGLKTRKVGSAPSSALERLRNAQTSFGDKVRKLRGGDATSPSAAKHPISPEPEPASNSPTPVSPRASTRPPRKSSLNTTIGRPEWKGGSGRTTLVDPVQDTPQQGPLQIPRKSSKREKKAIKNRDSRTVAGPVSLSPVSPSESETDLSRVGPTVTKHVSPHRATPSPIQEGQDAGKDYPSPPNSALPSHAIEPGTPTTPTSVNIDSSRAVRRKPTSSTGYAPRSTSHHAPHFSTASSIYSTFDTTTVPHHSGAANMTVTTRNPKSPPTPDAPASTTPADDNWVQPPSRFSITTYATSAHTRSPNVSVDIDAPPLPAPPQGYSQSQADVGSPEGAYMSNPYTSPAAEMRRVAALGYDNSPWKANAAPSVMSERPGSVASTSKALPPAPPELQTANDRVGHLNARLESLANRRININKGIAKMTELMPTDNLMASDAVLRKREAEKVKVEGLRAELAEVQRMEYELGLKLHRAYKRQDREAEFEPTGLWVRRVTGPG